MGGGADDGVVYFVILEVEVEGVLVGEVGGVGEVAIEVAHHWEGVADCDDFPTEGSDSVNVDASDMTGCT